MAQIEVGLRGESSVIVTEAHTAQQMRSGSLAVFATPAMIALMEAAAVAALAPVLPDDQSSVGTAVDVKHLAATPVGQTVRAQAEITAVDGRTITFKVQAWDQHDLIGEGTHTRVVINVERFMARVQAKQS